MGNIVLLDDLTINKIAAGEVIERPASVIKELVENSIDAGANNITVEFRNGGISYIRVIDNGKGIMPDDMEIAFERHATSKIRVADDLQNVKSMGFRGEALASIAAISKLTMQSKTMDQDIGYKIVAEGGKLSEKEEVGTQNGTIIEVENLFYNTPVRYKFLRKDFTEAGYIEDVITRIALVHPEISIKLINTGKTVIQTSGNGELRTVIYNIYGKEIAENIIDVNYEYDDIRITGVIGKPEIARSNRSNQMFFVNSRYVKDKILTSSAEQAFKDKLPSGKFGFLVLNISINPASVDVNVHPAKLEVRFEEEQKVFKAVYHAIKDELLKAMGVEIKDELQKQNETIKGFEINNKEPENTQINFSNDIYTNSFENKEPKGLFKKFFNRNNETFDYDEKPTMIEEIYNTRRLDLNEVQKEKNDDITLNHIEKNISENTEQSEEKRLIDQNEENNKTDIHKESKIEETQVINTNEIRKHINNDENVTDNENNSEQQKDNNDNFVINNELDTKYGQVEDIDETQLIQKIDNLENNIKNQDTIVVDVQEDEVSTNKIEETQVINLNNMEKESQEEIQEQKENLEIESSNDRFADMYSSIFGTKPKIEKEEQQEEKKYELPEPELKSCKNLSLFNDTENKVVPNYKFIGIAFSNYIIIEIDKEIYIIDQYIANEKLIYEKIKNNYYNDTEKDSQIMLLPDLIDLTSKEMDIARENIEMFEKAGFILEEFGENTIKLIGVPSVCMELDTKELFVDILNQINKVARIEKEEIEEKFLATLAKNASREIKIIEDKQEVTKLLEELLALDDPFICKSGRTAAIEITKEDIEKKFSRR